MRRLLVWGGILGSTLAAAADSVHADAAPPWLTGESDPADLVVSLVTMGPGDEVHQYFGHTGLEVRDERHGVAALYNFGAFGFDPGFLLEFLQGRLEFWVSVQDPEETYAFYARQDRDVRILELPLSPEEKRTLAKEAAIAALPANRRYLYHHYLDNCATRIRDLLDRATSSGFRATLTGPARHSYRDHTRRYAARDPIIDWLLIFAMNDSMEAEITAWDELFLPEELERAVAAFLETRGERVENVSWHRALRSRPVFEHPPRTWPWTLGIGLFSGAIFLALGRWARHASGRGPARAFALLTALQGMTFGLAGLTLPALALFTEHHVTYGNENLFFVSPLTFLLLPLGIAAAFEARWAWRALERVWALLAALASLGVAAKALPSFDQENLLVWTLLLPLTLGAFVGIRGEKNWRTSPSRVS